MFPKFACLQTVLSGLLLGFLALLPAQLAADDSAAAESESSRTRFPQPVTYCGVQSLFRGMQALGKDVEFQDLVKPEYISSKQGSSVGDLKKAAQHLGVYLEPMSRMTCEMLKQSQLPVILHVKSDFNQKDYNHWVLFMGTVDGKAKIYDGEQPEFFIDYEELAARWDGNGLVLSDRPIPTAAVRLGILGSVLFYTGLVALAVGILLRVERHFVRPHRQPSWRLSFVSGLRQAAALMVIVFGAMSAYRLGSAEGYLSNPHAIAASQDSQFGTFLPKLTTSQVARQLETPGVAIVDARLPTDFHAGHLPGAVSIPVNSTPDHFQAALAHVPQDSRIVIYSHSNGCPYGENVAKELIALGYKKIWLYRGGWVEWAKQNPAVSTAPQVARRGAG